MTDQTTGQEQPQGTPPANQGEQGSNNPAPEWVTIRLQEQHASGIRKGQKQLLEELGIDDPQKLKSIIEEHAALKAGELSAIESANAKFEKLQAEHAQALSVKSELEQQLEQVKTTQVKTQIEQALKDTAKLDPTTNEDLLLLVWAKYPQEAQALLVDDKIDAEKAQALINTIAKERPHWFKQKGQGFPSSSNRNNFEVTANDLGGLPDISQMTVKI